jgi:hypothetical protein
LPADLHDFLSSEGVQLRLDDHNRATGQTIEVTASAAQAATSLPCTALASPLLAGTVLEFDGGGLALQAEVTLSAVAPAGSVALTTQPLAVAMPPGAQAFDNGVNLALAFRALKACYYGTSRVKLYCNGRYDDQELVKSWNVNRWAVAVALCWLCRRRLLPSETACKEAEEAMAEMKMVQTGQLNVDGAGTRTSSWPFMSNLTLDVSYDYRRLRVQQSMSEPTPTQYSQAVDWNSSLSLWEF